jgi:hypothetical protein
VKAKEYLIMAGVAFAVLVLMNHVATLAGYGGLNGSAAATASAGAQAANAYSGN